MWAPLGQKESIIVVGCSVPSTGSGTRQPLVSFMEWKGHFTAVYSCCIVLEVSPLASASRTVGTPPASLQPLVTTYSGSLKRGWPTDEKPLPLRHDKDSDHCPYWMGTRFTVFCWQIHLDHDLLEGEQEDSSLFLYVGLIPWANICSHTETAKLLWQLQSKRTSMGHEKGSGGREGRAQPESISTGQGLCFPVKLITLLVSSFHLLVSFQKEVVWEECRGSQLKFSLTNKEK